VTLALVIETATAACSVALVEDGRVVAALHEVVGRGHAERLLPMIAELPDGGRARHILVDVGPAALPASASASRRRAGWRWAGTQACPAIRRSR